MTETLRALTRKLLAVAILFAAAYGVMTLAVGPLAAQHADLLDGIQMQRSLLGRLTAAAAQETAASTKGRLPDGASKGPIFLEGESDAIRIASLQSKLSEAAQGIGARLSSTQAVPPRDVRDVRLAGVQTQFNTTLEKLQKFIFDLETARPLLFIETLHVSRGPDRDGQEVNDLDVRLVVLGATPRIPDSSSRAAVPTRESLQP